MAEYTEQAGLQPDAAQPDAAQPDAAQPDAARPADARADGNGQEKPEQLPIWQRFVMSRGGDSASNETDDAPTSAFATHVLRLMRPPTLDVDVVSHCNLNCAACCHFSPAASPTFLSLENYKRDLEKLARIEGIGTYFEAICLMGGEPLLHPDLPAFIRATHEFLPDAQVRVVSNGVLLRSMPEAFWEAMRLPNTDLLMTPYPVGIDYVQLEDLARSEGVVASIGGGLSAGNEADCYFLRTPLDESGSQNPTSSFIDCPLAGSTMQLLDGRIFPCNRGALLGIVNERFGTSFAHEPDDYLELDSIANTGQIESFRRSERPMCRYCASSIAERIDWHVSAVDRYEWLMRPDEYEAMGI